MELIPLRVPATGPEIFWSSQLARSPAQLRKYLGTSFPRRVIGEIKTFNIF